MGSIISPVPVPTCDNPIDLDVWLDLPWGRIWKATLSHADILTALGNTVGSHADLDLPHSVLLIRSVSMEFGGFKHDYLVSYVVRVGETVLSLCQAVLRGG